MELDIDGDTVNLTPGKVADIIQGYTEGIENSNHDQERDKLKRELKAFLFDLRNEIVYALRLIDVENAAS